MYFLFKKSLESLDIVAIKDLNLILSKYIKKLKVIKNLS